MYRIYRNRILPYYWHAIIKVATAIVFIYASFHYMGGRNEAQYNAVHLEHINRNRVSTTWRIFL